ncbi:MAG TPA: hypothetical protein VMY16_12775 [Ilumatobacteraceae bacterium]|nr:hypothetical protein [Ilumatobacteraceae bacterium]
MPEDSEVEEGHVFRHHDEVEIATPGEVDAYDLDDDGKISLAEMGRAKIGIVDARLEQIAEHDGITGKVAGAAHKVLDAIDNDET